MMVQELDNFDLEKWESECRRYERNKEGLGFTASCDIKDGKLSIHLNNIENKYRDKVKSLMLKNAQGAVLMLCSIFIPNYVLSDQDTKEEAQKCSEVMNKETEPLLNILFQEGFDCFIESAFAYSRILQCKYYMDKMKCVNGTWFLGKNQWNGSGWMDENGSVFYDSFSSVWKEILSVPVQRKMNAA